MQTNLTKIIDRRQKIDFSELPNIFKNRNKIKKALDKNQTPIFFTDKQVLANRISMMKKSLQKHWGNYQLAYSFKTNYEIAKLDILKKENVWAEVVSGKEYSLAKKYGFKGNQIIFNGPYKRSDKLRIALKNGSIVFIDNLDELKIIKLIADSSSKNYEVGIRVNVKIPRIKQSRFGFSIDKGEAKKVVNLISHYRNVDLTGLHIHIGTNIDNPASFRYAAKSIAAFVENIIPNLKVKLSYLNFGGGFPSRGIKPYKSRIWNPQPIEKYLKSISEEFTKIYPDNQKPLLILEPGRYFADDAVFFITKVVSNKISDLQSLVIDASITMIPLIYYRPQIVKIFDKNLKEKKGKKFDTKIYGASCQEDDIVYKGYLPKLIKEDFIVFFVIGAYNQSMSSDFIFDRPKTLII